MRILLDSKKFLSLAVIVALGFLASFIIVYGASSARNSSVSLKADNSLFVLAISDPDGISEFALQPPGKGVYGGGVPGCPTIFNSKNVQFVDPDDFTPLMKAVITDCKGNVLELELLPPEKGISKGKIITPEPEKKEAAPSPIDSELKPTPKPVKKEPIPARIANTTSDAPFTIGAWDDRFGVTELFSGLIDEVSVSGPSGLVSRWDGDEALGNNGTISGGVTLVAGKSGKAFKFDGSSGHIDMGNPSSLNFGTGPFSLELWFNWDGKEGVNNIVRKSDYPVRGSGAGYWLRIGGGNLEFFTGETTGIDGEPRGIISTPISAKNWHHVVATRDGSGVMKLYVDDSLEGTAQASILIVTEPIKEEPNPTKSIKDIKYPVAPLGNCGSEDECRTYCDDRSHVEACLAFAKEYGLITDDEFQDAEKFKKIDGGPGGCNSRASCETYCNTTEHLDECIAFADTNDVLTPDELAEAKKFQAALKRGVKPPAACTNKASCETYCNNPNNIEECLNFAEEAGFISGDELTQARKFMELLGRGETPGNCKNKEQCENYCSEDEHVDECIAFAEKAGFISEEDREMIRKTGGKGPGNCRSKAQCEAYCEANQEECFTWAQEKGVVPEEDLARMREGMQQFRGQFDKMPPEVVDCFKETIGEETLNKILAGEPVFARDMGEKMQSCFEKFAGSFGEPGEGMGGPGGEGGFPGGDFSGPGGCKSQEECRDYCLNNLEACKDFSPPGGGDRGQQSHAEEQSRLQSHDSEKSGLQYQQDEVQQHSEDQSRIQSHDSTKSGLQFQHLEEQSKLQSQQQTAPAQTYPTHDATQSAEIQQQYQQQYPSGAYPQ